MQYLSSHVRGFAAAMGIVLCTVIAANAQFTITLPSIPKIKKDKPKPTPSPDAGTQDDSNSMPAASDNRPSSNARADEPVAKKGCEADTFYQVWNEDIQKTMDDVKSFTPGRDYFVRDFSDDENRYLKMALSDSQRKDYEKNWADDDTKKCVNDRLDELAAAADKTIGGYKPVGYTLGTPAEKNILKSAVSDIGQATVFNIGLKSAVWQIVKNDLGIPERRKRFGTIWLKHPGNKYCTLVYVNLIQEYAGGGTYNSSEAQFVSWEFAGCPAGK